MDLQSILSAIDAEITTLHQARTLLSKAADSGSGRGNRAAIPLKVTKRVTHRMSPEGLKRIADAQRKRWAAAKKQKTAVTG